MVNFLMVAVATPITLFLMQTSSESQQSFVSAQTNNLVVKSPAGPPDSLSTGDFNTFVGDFSGEDTT